jgi:hypothetical protein
LDYPAKLATIVKLYASERLFPLGHLGPNYWEKIYMIWLALRCGWEYEVNKPFGEYDESNLVDAGPANAKPVDATSGAYSGAGHVVGTFTGVDQQMTQVVETFVDENTMNYRRTCWEEFLDDGYLETHIREWFSSAEYIVWIGEIRKLLEQPFTSGIGSRIASDSGMTDKNCDFITALASQRFITFPNLSNGIASGREIEDGSDGKKGFFSDLTEHVNALFKSLVSTNRTKMIQVLAVDSQQNGRRVENAQVRPCPRMTMQPGANQFSTPR